jgi:transposase
MMRNRTKLIHLVVDGLPGYAPELNPDERVWCHVKRTDVSRTPLRKSKKLSEKIEMQLAAIKKVPHLVRVFKPQVSPL